MTIKEKIEKAIFEYNEKNVIFKETPDKINPELIEIEIDEKSLFQYIE